MTPLGLLRAHSPQAEALTGLDDELGPSPKGDSVGTSAYVHTLGQRFT